jgi:hypothetical protein
MSLPRSISLVIATALLATLAGCSGPLSSTPSKMARQPPVLAYRMAPTPPRASTTVTMTALNARRSLDLPRHAAPNR